MSVETSAQASALNSGNPILKTYDLVAVKPLNQNLFDIACQSSQVDLISIDFSQKLPFRMKLPMVKAAIARGVYFEIMYSSLLLDVQVRRQMIANAKLLVEWTRGKNLIVSSSAPSVLELRGPNDVANLVSLIGLSNDFAKATISKNCRLLIANALRKKQFYKEAIRIEEMPPGTQTDPKAPWIVDDMDWDPLSSGEGDLLLDDMEKAFAQSAKVPQSVQGIDVISQVDGAQIHGLQVNQVASRTEGKLHVSGNSTNIFSSSKDIELPKRTSKPQDDITFLCRGLMDQQGKSGEDSLRAVLTVSPLASDNVEDFSVFSAKPLQELTNMDVLENASSPARLCEVEFQNHVSIGANNVLSCDSLKELASEDNGSVKGPISGLVNEVLKNSEDRNCYVIHTDIPKLLSGVLDGEDAEISTEMQFCDQSDSSIFPNLSLGVSLQELKEDLVADKKSTMHTENVMNLVFSIEKNSNDGMVEGMKEQNVEKIEVKTDTKELIHANTMMLVEPLLKGTDSHGPLVAKSMLSDTMMTKCSNQVQEIGKFEDQSLGEQRLGNRKIKRWVTGQVIRFPFKRLLQVQFKKKGRILTYKTKKRFAAIKSG
ncbi:uncharacterized protein LOC130827507 isoform X2 [Amaranthus tricolor]|nr:uncharacterized protein LOC130827507 isoform X2 [Amaranthus tricolor]